MTKPAELCACGDDDEDGCLYMATGYPFCRSCEEHHRPPDCPIDEQGRALCPCGVPWPDCTTAIGS